MAKYVVRQPNGLYAVWSTVCDNFVLVQGTAKGTRNYLRQDGWTSEQVIEAVAQAKADRTIFGEQRVCDPPLHRWFSCLRAMMCCRGTGTLAKFLAECPETYQEAT